MNKLLEIKNVSLTYQTIDDEICAIKDLSFDCYEGQFISIIGPSGCGKTTILSMIAGILSPSGGEILFNGKPVSTKSDLGYMLQKDHLFPWRTIEKNIYLPLEIKKKMNNENKAFADSLLKKYGIYDFAKKYPDKLSGGMKQRVALIRTLVSNPQLLLLDEPFSAIDYQTKLAVCDDVYSIIRQEKKTAILVTHDISEAISMSDVIVCLTNRPAKVKKIFYPELTGDTPLKRRESAKFGFYFEQIWKELNK